MNESLDIMSRDAVDEYKVFLLSLRDEMDGLLEMTGQVAEKLDGHDMNRFTSALRDFLKGIAENAIQVCSGIYTDVVEGFLRGLEEKNDIVGRSAQGDYIQELRDAARQLEDLQPYRDCELVSGGAAFNSEEQEEFLGKHIYGLVDAWDEAVAGLKVNAEALQGSMTQDEMSETFVQITAALENMVIDIADSAAQAGIHLLDIQENYNTRKQQFAKNAEEESSSIQKALSGMLGDTLENLTNIIF